MKCIKQKKKKEKDSETDIYFVFSNSFVLIDIRNNLMGNICKSQGPKKIVLGSYSFYGKADSMIMGDRIELPPPNKYPEMFQYQESWTIKDSDKEIHVRIAYFL